MIAWVTHHLPRDTDSNNSAHLPGKYVGGAEMTDAALLAAAPVDVDIVPAWEWERALDADHVIITGTDLLPTQAMERLAGTSPTVFLHHEQTRAYARRQLIDAARVLILHTPAHEAMERRWTNPKRVELVLSPMDPTECWAEPKQDHAVWAQRMHDLKGPRAARLWAIENGIRLQMLTNAPRAKVLDALAVARWFVHLPLGFESESRATIEAVLSGCKCVTNERVGITSVDGWSDPQRLADMVASAADKWWQVALP
jgi:hypothetical protein